MEFQYPTHQHFPLRLMDFSEACNTYRSSRFTYIVSLLGQTLVWTTCSTNSCSIFFTFISRSETWSEIQMKITTMIKVKICNMRWSAVFIADFCNAKSWYASTKSCQWGNLNHSQISFQFGLELMLRCVKLKLRSFWVQRANQYLVPGGSGILSWRSVCFLMAGIRIKIWENVAWKPIELIANTYLR